MSLLAEALSDPSIQNLGSVPSMSSGEALRNEPDMYVLGFQEIVLLNAGNVLVLEDNEPAAKWLALINQSLNDPPDQEYVILQYVRLNAKVEILQRSQRNILGEDIAQMNTTELEQLENQLEATLKNIRSTKTQFMLDQLADLHNRETELVETNNALKSKSDVFLICSNAMQYNAPETKCHKQLEETDNSQISDHGMALEVGGPNIHYTLFPPQSEGFFNPLGVNHNLQIGYNPMGLDDLSLNMHGFASGWML